jgi:MFS family permease
MNDPASLAPPPTPSVGAGYPLGRAYAWYVVLVFALVYTCSFLDRQILSLLVEPIKRDLHLSDTQISLLQGLAFALCNALAGLPLGYLVDTKRRIPIIGAGIAFWSLTTSACATARSFAGLLVLRMGVGVGEATLTPAANSVIGDLFPPGKVGLPLAIYSLGVFAGGGLALILGGALIGWLESLPRILLPIVGELRPWQAVFAILGFPGLLLAAWIFTLGEPPRGAAADFDGPHLTAALRYMADHRWTFLWLNLSFGVLAMVGYGMAAWAPTFFIRAHGWTAGRIGHAYGLIFMLCGAGGVVSGGMLGDLLQRRGLRNPRLKVVVLATAAAAPFVISFPVVQAADTGLVLLAGAVYFSTFVNGLSPALLQQMVPNQMRGLTVSLSLLAQNLLGLGLGPTLVALSTDYLFRDESRLGLSLSMVTGLLLLIALLLLRQAYGPYLATRASLESRFAARM